MEILAAGNIAPQFEAIDQNEKIIKLSDYSGKKVILYFYPRDNTPGCTAEACNLNDNYADLTAKGFVVIGVSPDSATSHLKFISKYNLSFNLIADTNKEILKLYGAWGIKKNYGKTYEGVLRKTIIIDEKGIIIAIIDKVKTKDHYAQILQSL